MSYSVGEVASLARITVRTLHHYDEVGLLRAEVRTPSRYRVYSPGDLQRLQHILGYRQLGFSLDQIKAILDDPDIDPLEHLGRQRSLLTTKIEQLQRMVASVDKTMEARRMGINLTPDEMFEVFGDAEPGGFADEAEQRWGDTDAYHESERRTATYSKDQWKEITAEWQQLQLRFAAAQTQGLPPDSAVATDLAEEHRQHLSRWFYDCGFAMHRGIGDLYVQDPRFSANLDKAGPGLERYVRDAIHANADRQSG